MDTTWLARLPHRTFADINAGSLKLEQIETPVRKGVDVHGECNGTCRTVELPIPDNAMQMTLFHLVQDQEARVRASTATGYYCVLLRQQQQEQYNSFHAVGRVLLHTPCMRVLCPDLLSIQGKRVHKCDVCSVLSKQPNDASANGHTSIHTPAPKTHRPANVWMCDVRVTSTCLPHNIGTINSYFFTMDTAPLK